MKIKCFGIARDIVGSSELQLDSPVSTVLDTVALTATDEIALIPPVSGG